MCSRMYANIPLITFVLVLKVQILRAAVHDTNLIPGHDTLASVNYKLNALCAHPTNVNRMFATAKHALLEFDWSVDPSVATSQVAAGGPSSGFSDDTGTYAKFNDPRDCTVFGGMIALIDYKNDAVRTYDPDKNRVDTIIRKGANGYTDGPYTGSTSTGGGVAYPSYIEAINSTHLIVVHIIAQVRLIDTVHATITTLVDSTVMFLNFFFHFNRQGFYATAENESRIVLYYFPLDDILYGIADTTEVYWLVDYNGIDSNGVLSTGSKSETSLGIYSQSWGVDVGSYLILPDNLWMDVLYVIDKTTYSTAVYQQLSSASAVVLVPGPTATLYAADDTDLVRLHAMGVVPPAAATTTEPIITTTPTKPTTKPARTTKPTTTTTKPTTITNATTTTTTTTKPATTTTTTPTTTPTTTTTKPTTTTTATTTTTKPTTTTTTTTKPTTTTTATTTTTKPTTTTTTTKPTTTTTTNATTTTTTEPKTTERPSSTITTQFSEKVTSNSENNSVMNPHKQTTTVAAKDTTETLQIYQAPAAGTQQFSVPGKNSLCPATADTITELLVKNVQVCSVHCVNIALCAGFHFNKLTGKCRLLESWSASAEYRAGGESDRCYRLNPV